MDWFSLGAVAVEVVYFCFVVVVAVGTQQLEDEKNRTK